MFLSLKNTSNYYGVIYEIENTLNRKTYVGQTTRKDKNFARYWGSGLLISRAIEKYGIENFDKRIIFYCSSKDQLNNLERLWIKITKPEYNIATGGQGGFICPVWNKGKELTCTHKEHIKIGMATGKTRTMNHSNSNNPMYGKTHSENTLSLMSSQRKGRKPLHKNNKIKYVYTEEELNSCILDGWVYNEPQKICINNSLKNKRVIKKYLQNYLDNGWVLGKIMRRKIK